MNNYIEADLNDFESWVNTIAFVLISKGIVTREELGETFDQIAKMNQESNERMFERIKQLVESLDEK